MGVAEWNGWSALKCIYDILKNMFDFGFHGAKFRKWHTSKYRNGVEVKVSQVELALNMRS